ncbi:hypothetical protein [Microbulbifer thermotolerans]|uniref:hypothetical protein n=1 Tax=Microbulbifer thermotolerans TaxID=252514 RepID=UPI0022495FA5|nr:hypothetical protein [Microbulbifer thermotolerans]MCX2833089.1 hypothetical protein [Microbulbifer thermotolerans]
MKKCLFTLLFLSSLVLAEEPELDALMEEHNLKPYPIEKIGHRQFFTNHKYVRVESGKLIVESDGESTNNTRHSSRRQKAARLSLNVMTMEEIRVDGSTVKASEVEIFKGNCFRVLKSVSGNDYYLGYMVSIGPYKFDLELYRKLTNTQTKEYQSETLDVISLAKNWSNEDTQVGKFESRS